MAKTGPKAGNARAPREKRIAPPEETAELKFRESMQSSPYRDLLEDLMDAPKGSTLKIARQARYTVVKHLRALGMKVLWAKRGDDLYVKVVGEAETPLTFVSAVKQTSKANDAERLVLRALADGPMTVKELGREVGAAPTSLAGTLSRMVAQRSIETEDGVYRAVRTA